MPITIITGPPGAGKTTVSAAYARSVPLGVHLVADQCFHWIVSGYVPPWRRESHRQNITVIDAVGAAAGRFAAGGYEVAVDGIVGPWLLAEFHHATGIEAADVRYVVLRPERAVARQRALGRTGQLDLVDPGPIEAMYDAFSDLGPFESHVIDSSDYDATATVDAVRHGHSRVGASC